MAQGLESPLPPSEFLLRRAIVRGKEKAVTMGCTAIKGKWV